MGGEAVDGSTSSASDRGGKGLLFTQELTSQPWEVQALEQGCGGLWRAAEGLLEGSGTGL